MPNPATPEASPARALAPTPRSRYERHRPRILTLFAQRGYGQVSLRDIATHLELTVGTLYHHCPGKQALLFEFIEEHYEALLNLFGPRAAPLGKVLARLMTLHQRSPAHFQLALHERQWLEGDYQQRIEDLRAQVGGRLSHLLLAGCSARDRRVLVAPALAMFEQLPLWHAQQSTDGHAFTCLGERLLTATLIRFRQET